jgi:hypothetical protein
MKKIYKILPLGVALGLVTSAFVATAVSQKASVESAKAVLDVTDYVEMKASNIWSDQYAVGDQIRAGDYAFLGKFYGTTRPVLDTATLNENSTGDIRTDDFNQTGEYVSFLIGGNPCGGDNFVNLWSTDKSYNIASGITNDAFNGGTITHNMTFKYVFVPKEYRGKCLLYIHDGVGEREGQTYRGVTISDLRINQSWDDVVESFSAHIASYKLSCVTEQDTNAYTDVKAYYDSNAYYKDLRDSLALKTSADDSFEKQNGLINWAYDRVGSVNPNGDRVNINYNDIISSAVAKVDGWFEVPMPFNRTGSRFLNADSSGIAEDCKYRLVSSEFTLSGTGLISAKLGGGTAVLQLLKASDYTVLKSTSTGNTGENPILNPGFRDTGVREDSFNIVKNDLRLNTMSRTYLDCAEYVGQRVRVALSDDRTGGNWGLAFFDEVKTYYETLPSFQLDVIAQTQNDATYHGVVKDQYVGPTGDKRTTFGKAFDFVSNFYSKMRNPNNAVSFCSIAQSEDVQGLLTTYNGLLPAVKTIVDASQDYTYGKTVTSENWYLSEVDTTTYTIAMTLEFIATGTVSSAANNGSLLSNHNGLNTVTAIAIFASIFAVIVLAMFIVVNKKRKEQR